MFLDLLYNKNFLITTTREDLFAFLCRGRRGQSMYLFPRRGVTSSRTESSWIDIFPRLQATFDWQTSQAQRYFGLIDSPGSKLIWIDRLPRLQADEFTDSQGSRPQLQAHLDWQTAPALGSFWLTDCPSSRLIWIDRLLGGGYIYCFPWRVVISCWCISICMSAPTVVYSKIIISFSDSRHAILVAQVSTHWKCSNKVIWD